jgi:hypothetical protein
MISDCGLRIADFSTMQSVELKNRTKEADELTAIAVASIRTARRSSSIPQSAVRNPQFR